MSPLSAGGRAKTLFVGALALLLLVAVAHVVTGVVAERNRKALAEAWRSDPQRPRASALEAVRANDASRVVNELERRFGFADEVADEDGTPGWSVVEEPLRDWLDAQIFSSSAVIEEPPPAVQDWLFDRDVLVEALTLQLLEEEPPRWDWNPARPFDAEAAPATLHVVLLAAAAERARDGHPVAALALIDASWRLNENARETPVRGAQLAADVTLRRQAALLSKLSRVPASWEQRLGEADPRGAMARALKLECEGLLASDDRAGHPALRAFRAPGPRSLFATPLTPLRIVDAARRGDAMIDAAGDACEAHAPAPAAWWNERSRAFLSGIGWAQGIATRTALELELATETLAARRQAEAGGQALGATSLLCPGRGYEAVAGSLELTGGPLPELRMQGRHEMRQSLAVATPPRDASGALAARGAGQ